MLLLDIRPFNNLSKDTPSQSVISEPTLNSPLVMALAVAGTELPRFKGQKGAVNKIVNS